VVLAASAQALKETKGPIDISSEGGEAHLGTELGVELKSTNNKGHGKFENGISGSAITTFFNVTVAGSGGKCTSAGQEAGTVQTEPLTEELGYINAGSQSVGAAFKPAGSFDAVFECEGLGSVKVRNSVIGTITSPAVNFSAKTGTLALKGFGGFKQEPENLEGKPKDTLESSFEKVGGGVFTPSAQFQEDTTTNHGNGSVCKVKIKKGVETEKCKNGATEINTLANPAQPEIGRCIKQKGGKFQEANCGIIDPTPGKGKFEFKPAEPGENAKGF
jgi:hypothetical protein